MDDEEAVHRGIGQRQHVVLDQGGAAGPRRRPVDDALPGRHEGEGAVGLLAENAEIGRAIAEPDGEHAAGRGPVGADGARHHAPRDHAELRGVEGAEIDDVRHGTSGGIRGP